LIGDRIKRLTKAYRDKKTTTTKEGKAICIALK